METIATIVKFGSSKLEFSIPSSWSINKMKCLLASQIPSLNFDQFELSHMGKLLRGTFKLKGVGQKSRNMKQIELEIVKTKSDIKLNEYYKSSMGKFMSSSTYRSQPVLSIDYQKYKNIMRNEGVPDNNANMNAIQELDQEDPNPAIPANPLFRALRLIGFYFILVLLWDHGKAYQLAIIASVILFYYAIEIFIKHRQRKIRKNKNNTQKRIQGKEQQQANQPQKEEIKQNKLRGMATLYYYKTIEIIFCFLLTFFPNLSIDMHLQINREKIQTAREKVNTLLPNSYAVEVNANRDH